VLGVWCFCVAVSCLPDVVVRPVFLERLFSNHGVPLHYLQHLTRDVHLHLPLSFAEE
ncbi:hypothetical protein M9458_003218, partial [Cirrhinus mrigala]